MEINSINNLIEEINYLKEAQDLLFNIWLEIEPDVLDPALYFKLKDHFNIDDSE